MRAEANLRQSELGKAIGFSGQVVSNVERGYSFPSTEFVNRSAACFGVPADYILGRTTSRYAVADPKEVSAVQARIKALDTSMDYLVGNSDYSCRKRLRKNDCFTIFFN